MTAATPFHAALALGALIASPATATAAVAPPARCTVAGADKLPVASGGSAALCRAIARAAAARRIRAPFTVQVRVGKRSTLMADVTLARGKRLATLHHAEMDRTIGRSTIERFARALADHVVAGMRQDH